MKPSNKSKPKNRKNDKNYKKITVEIRKFVYEKAKRFHDEESTSEMATLNPLHSVNILQAVGKRFGSYIATQLTEEKL